MVAALLIAIRVVIKMVATTRVVMAETHIDRVLPVW